jgi:hypothetical protein
MSIHDPGPTLSVRKHALQVVRVGVRGAGTCAHPTDADNSLNLTSHTCAPIRISDEHQ